MLGLDIAMKDVTPMQIRDRVRSTQCDMVLVGIPGQSSVVAFQEGFQIAQREIFHHHEKIRWRSPCHSNKPDNVWVFEGRHEFDLVDEAEHISQSAAWKREAS